MSKFRKILFPAMAGRTCGVEIKIGEELLRFDIPAGGLPIENEEAAKALEAHVLHNHVHGFVLKDPESLNGEKKDSVFTGLPSFADLRPKAETPKKVEIIDADVDEEEIEESSDEETVTAEETEDSNADGVITAEDVSNINQAKDFLLDTFEDVDGRKINTKAKILAEAKNRNVKFPNLK